jgi:hypothetical protein
VGGMAFLAVDGFVHPVEKLEVDLTLAAVNRW